MTITRTRINAEAQVKEYTRKKGRAFSTAKLGNNSGDIQVASTSYVWIRLHGDTNQVVRAENPNSIPLQHNLAVIVETVKRGGVSRYVVIGREGEIYNDDPYANAVGEHAAQHEIKDFGAGGFDSLNIYTRARVELRARAQTTPDMTLWVEHGKYQMNGVEVFWTGGNSPTFTAPSAGYKRFDLLYFNAAGALAIAQGTAVQSSLFSIPGYPSAPTGSYTPLAYVLLSGGQTTITEASIADARIAWGSLGSGSLSAHDIIGAFHTVTGAAGKLIGLTALNTLGLVDAYTLPTPGTLTVSTTNSASGAHTHAITSSSNVSAGASALLASSLGALTLKTLTVTGGGDFTLNNSSGNKLIFGDATNKIVRMGYMSATPYADEYSRGNRMFCGDDSAGSSSFAMSSSTLKEMYFGIKTQNAGGGVFTGELLANRDAGGPRNTSFGSWNAIFSYSATQANDYYTLAYTAAGGNQQTFFKLTAPGLFMLGENAYMTNSNHLAQFFIRDGGYGGVINLLRLSHEVYGAGTAGTGTGMLWQIKSSTTSDTTAMQQSVEWTDATHATRNVLTRNATYPGGSIVGYTGQWSRAGIDGTSRTVIANATGDVTKSITVLYQANAVTGTFVGGGVVTLTPNTSYAICSDGTSTLTLTCASDGSVTIARSAGTDTFDATLWMVWR